ncbi:MAG: hypothetical protein AAGF07_02755 [Patescibacteria group bacterium]
MSDLKLIETNHGVEFEKAGKIFNGEKAIYKIVDNTTGPESVYLGNLTLFEGSLHENSQDIEVKNLEYNSNLGFVKFEGNVEELVSDNNFGGENKKTSIEESSKSFRNDKLVRFGTTSFETEEKTLKKGLNLETASAKTKSYDLDETTPLIYKQQDLKYFAYETNDEILEGGLTFNLQKIEEVDINNDNLTDYLLTNLETQVFKDGLVETQTTITEFLGSHENVLVQGQSNTDTTIDHSFEDIPFQNLLIGYVPATSGTGFIQEFNEDPSAAG